MKDSYPLHRYESRDVMTCCRGFICLCSNNHGYFITMSVNYLNLWFHIVTSYYSVTPIIRTVLLDSKEFV